MHTHDLIHSYKPAIIFTPPEQPHALTHSDTHAHAHTHTHTHASIFPGHARARTHTHTRTHANTRKHTHTHLVDDANDYHDAIEGWSSHFNEVRACLP